MDVLKLRPSDLPEVLRLYRTVTADLRARGIHQWDRFYPNRFILARNLGNGDLYGIRRDDQIIAAAALNQEQSKAYRTIEWMDPTGRFAVLHRLAVHPDVQGRGLGRRMLEFSENLSRSGGSTSIRLDVCSANSRVVAMYEQAGYVHRGIVRFPFRRDPYFCMELLLHDPAIS